MKTLIIRLVKRILRWLQPPQIGDEPIAFDRKAEYGAGCFYSEESKRDMVEVLHRDARRVLPEGAWYNIIMKPPQDYGFSKKLAWHYHPRAQRYKYKLGYDDRRKRYAVKKGVYIVERTRVRRT